jgi:hypothetical protein
VTCSSGVPRNVAKQLTTMNIRYSNANPQGLNCGFDCSGLVLYVFQKDPDNMLKLPRTAAAREPVLEKPGEFTTGITKGQPGDAVSSLTLAVESSTRASSWTREMESSGLYMLLTSH